MSTTNRRVVLTRRPVEFPTANDFRHEQADVPQPAEGQVLLRTLYLSLDPYMRMRMVDSPNYEPAVPLGEAMIGSTVNRVVVSRHPRFKAGDLVTGFAGWQEYALSDGSDLMPIDARVPHPSLALGVLGFPGFTAYHGLLNVGQPQAGETVVVSSAAGAVGAVAGQIAGIKGARVIGIAGGAQKCRQVVDDLGFDACLDYREPDLAGRLAAATPDGVDVYFENVGGAVFEAVLPRLNKGARVPLCGVVSIYNEAEPPVGPDRFGRILWALLTKAVRLQGFTIPDHVATGFEDFTRDVSQWVQEGRVKLPETVIDGLEQAPQALVDLLSGRYSGKVVVRVGDDGRKAAE